jgi:hypothetical protein
MGESPAVSSGVRGVDDRELQRLACEFAAAAEGLLQQSPSLAARFDPDGTGISLVAFRTALAAELPALTQLWFSCLDALELWRHDLAIDCGPDRAAALRMRCALDHLDDELLPELLLRVLASAALKRSSSAGQPDAVAS